MDEFRKLATKARAQDVWAAHPKNPLGVVPPVLVRRSSNEASSVFYNFASGYANSFTESGALLYKFSTSDAVNRDLETLPSLNNVILYARLPDSYYRAEVQAVKRDEGLLLVPCAKKAF